MISLSNDRKRFKQYCILDDTIGTCFKKRSNSAKCTRQVTDYTWFFLSFILASTNRNASSSVDIFTGTVNAYVIAKYEESDPVIVNGLTAHWSFFDTINTVTFCFTRLFIRDLDMQIKSSARTSSSLWQYFPSFDRAISGTSSAHFFDSPDCLKNKQSILHS